MSGARSTLPCAERVTTNSGKHVTQHDSQRDAKRQKEAPFQHIWHNSNASGNSRNHYGHNYHHNEYHGPVHFSSGETGFGGQRMQASIMHREDVLSSLRYEVMDDHYLTIDPAHANTCRWLFQKDEYTDWLDATRLSEHHGFLWIKGHPGAGKTILMKSAYQHARKSLGDCTLISFFFNARQRRQVEMSTEGMYRSLLVQLLEKIPRLQPILDKHRQMSEWPVSMLSNLFREAVLAIEKDRLICYIDALDECAELEIRVMIRVFEDLAEYAVAQCINFSVCFSSRHYPNVTMNHCRELILEDQDGHGNDISAYIRHKLKEPARSKPGITTELRRKASGVFLWISLVIDILNKDNDQGHAHMIETRLKAVPDELDKLFQEIVKQGTEEDAYLVPTLRCIMFAKRPLSCQELYHAVRYDSNVNFECAGPETAKKFLLNSSKGLAGTTKGKKSTVQFIHESVRDYLLTTGLSTLTQVSFQAAERSSHEYLRLACLHFVSEEVLQRASLPESLPSARTREAEVLRQQASKLLPFLPYAVENVVFHTERACGSLVSPQEIVEAFPLSVWRVLNNMFEKHEVRRYTECVTRAYIFAEKDAPHLLKAEFQLKPDLFARTERHGSLLCAAIFEGNLEVVATVLKHGEVASYSLEEQQRCFEVAIEKQMPMAVDLLFRAGFDVNVEHKDYTRLLQKAHDRGYEQIVRKLLEKCSAGDARQRLLNSALQAACDYGYEQAAHLLLDHGAEINAQSGHYGNALQAACARGHTQLAQMLLSRGAKVDAQGGHHGSALGAAYTKGHKRVVQLLLAHGAKDEHIRQQQTPDKPAPYHGVYDLMQCREPLCTLGSYCWCDTTTGKHYHLLTPHLKRLIRHKNEGKKLESHDDIPDDLRQDLYAKG